MQDNQDGGFAVHLREPGCGTEASATAHGRSAPPTIHLRGQLTALRRCIGNLVENAVRYGGSAEIMLRPHADAICVTVTDNGPGIPEAELGRVLLPFYRVEAARNRHTGCVGLGLAIAHDIARRHGASLGLSNRAGCGLLAELSFPAARHQPCVPPCWPGLTIPPQSLSLRTSEL